MDYSVTGLVYPVAYLGQGHEAFFGHSASSSQREIESPLRLFTFSANDLRGMPEALIVVDKRYLFWALVTGDARDLREATRLLIGVSMPNDGGNEHPSLIIPSATTVVCARTSVAQSISDVQESHRALIVGVAKGDSVVSLEFLRGSGLPIEIVEYNEAPTRDFNQGAIDLIAPCGPQRNNPHWFSESEPYATPVLHFGSRPKWLSDGDARWPAVISASDFLEHTANPELLAAYTAWSTVPSNVAVLVAPPEVDVNTLNLLSRRLEESAKQTCLAHAIQEYNQRCPLQVTSTSEINEFVNQVTEPTVFAVLTNLLTPLYSSEQIRAAVGRVVTVMPVANPDLLAPDAQMSESVEHFGEGCWLVQFEWEYQFGADARWDAVVVDERAPGAPAVVSIQSSHEDTRALGEIDETRDRCVLPPE